MLCASSTPQTFIVTYYANASCHGDTLNKRKKKLQRPEQGCQTFHADVSHSYVLHGKFSDTYFYMVCFSESEYNSDKFIKEIDLDKNWNTSRVNYVGRYKNFQVYNIHMYVVWEVVWTCRGS